MDSFTEFLFEKVIVPLFLVIMALILIAALVIPVVFFLRDKDNPTVVLDETEFTCTQTYRYTSQTMIKSGNVYVPITNHHTRCDQWTRN